MWGLPRHLPSDEKSLLASGWLAEQYQSVLPRQGGAWCWRQCKNSALDLWAGLQKRCSPFSVHVLDKSALNREWSFATPPSLMTEQPKCCGRATREGWHLDGQLMSAMCLFISLSNEGICGLTQMGIHTGTNGRVFYFHCNTTLKQNVLFSYIFLSQRYSMILELAFILCFDHCEVLNPFVPQSEKTFWFYSRKPVNNEASRELFILSMIYFFFISVSMLIQFKM